MTSEIHSATSLKKKALIEALKSYYGNVSLAAKHIGIDRCSHYRWLKDDPEYKKQIASLQFDDALCDLAENALKERIEKGDITAIIFTLKTKGKHRGWIEGSGQVNSAPEEIDLKIEE